MEERSLRVVGTDKTFFNKLTNTLNKLLIPTQIGLNGIRISVKRNALLKAYEIAEEEEDGLIIHGKGIIKGAECKGYGDHRIIMALAVASAAAEGIITIDDEKAAAVTFPTFFTLLENIRK